MWDLLGDLYTNFIHSNDYEQALTADLLTFHCWSSLSIERRQRLGLLPDVLLKFCSIYFNNLQKNRLCFQNGRVSQQLFFLRPTKHSYSVLLLVSSFQYTQRQCQIYAIRLVSRFDCIRSASTVSGCLVQTQSSSATTAGQVPGFKTSSHLSKFFL